MKHEIRRLVDLRVYGNNPRMNTEAIPKVKESIRKYGYKVPIIIDRDNTIIAGHTRFAALLQLNEEIGLYSEITVIVADDLTDNEIKQFRIVDNQVGGIAKWDFTALRLELDDIDDFVLSDFGGITDFDLVVTDEIPEAESTGVKIQIGSEIIRLTDLEYHEWAQYIVEQKQMSVLEFVREALEIDQRNRQFDSIVV